MYERIEKNELVTKNLEKRGLQVLESLHKFHHKSLGTAVVHSWSRFKTVSTLTFLKH